MPDCRVELSPSGEQPFILGEAAHIIAKRPDGPRGDASVPVEKLDAYENLILLCPTQHAVVDKNPRAYSVEELRRIKHEHEEWVRVSLDGATCPPWSRPVLRFGERWHRVEDRHHGVIDRFGARWRLRVPYQAALRGDVFQTDIDGALARMDAEGPFCPRCGVELIESTSVRGLGWCCEGCGYAIHATRGIEGARAAVVRIGRAPVESAWRREYHRH